MKRKKTNSGSSQTRNSFRIVSGTWGGRRLRFAKNSKVRPTGDRARETLFNWLQLKIPGSRCLDLFAGSGALGIEALSRGAESCVFVEKHAPTAFALKDNLELLGTDLGVIDIANAMTFLKTNVDDYDVIFLDPPFDSSLLESALTHILSSECLAKGAYLYVEHAFQKDIELDLSALDLRHEVRMGNVVLKLFRQP